VIVNKPVSGKVVLKLDVDYLIVSGNPRVRLKELMTHFKTGKVILDASNPPWSIKAWMKEAHWLGLQCYSVSVSGAFREEF
jgi:competence protein ComEC